MRKTFFGDSGRRFLVRALVGMAAAAVLAVQSGDTFAQQNASSAIAQGLQNLSPDQMQQMFSGQGIGGLLGGQGSTMIQPQTTILEPVASAGSSQPQSRLEQIMSARAGVKLAQFGYEQLGVGRPISLPEVGGVQDDYILGPGDEIVINLRGQDNSEHRVEVDRDGNVVLPRISPVAASGLHFGQFRTQLLAAIHNAYLSTEAYVSIGRMRQISVMVAGEVGSPGVRILTGLSSPIDAILVSGGIKKSGSLRAVKLIHEGKTTTLDLYAYLTGGVAARQVTLGDGDRIVVPPLTKVVGAGGWLRRPGIFEIPPGQSAMTVRALTELAGGQELRGNYRIAILRIEPNGETQLAAVTSENELVHDGEVLMVLPGADQVVDRAFLSGGTPLAGSYSIKEGSKLSDILKAPGALGNSPYTIFGILSHRDPRTYLRTLIAFSPIAALDGQFDPALSSGDIVRVISMRESRMIAASLKAYAAQEELSEELKRNPFLASTSNQPAPMAATGQTTTSGQTSSVVFTTPNGQTVSPAGQVLDPTTGQLVSLNQQTGQAAANAANIANGGKNPFAEQFGFNPSNSGSGGQFAEYDRYTRCYLPSSTDTQSTSAAQPYTIESPQAIGGASTSGVPGQYPVGQYGLGQYVPGQSIPGMPQATGYPPTPIFMPQQQNQPPTPTPPNFEQQLPPSGVAPLNTEVCSLPQLAEQLDVDPIVLANFLSDHQATLDGAVRGPGDYVVGPGINLHDLVMVAGGTVRWADQSGVELISTDVDERIGRASTVRKSLPLNETTLASYMVRPHDELRFRQVFTDTGIGSVTLEGEVRFPGDYKIIRGEHLLDLLKRAGGLTDVAYPYGAIFLRRSVAALEEDAFRRAADDLEKQLLTAVGRPTTTTRTDSSVLTNAQSIVLSLRTQKGLGRISVAADPTILSVKPDENPLLEPGDVLFIPQRPSTVSVLGEVLQPGSFTCKPNLTAGDYLTKAGGYNAFADSDLTFVVLPDGSAEKLEHSWLPTGGQSLPPGSVIVVPRDIAPFSWTDFALNSSQIFSQLAVAGASLAVISAER